MDVPLSLRWMVESYILLLGMLMLGLCLVNVSMPRLRGVLRLCASVTLIALAIGALFYRQNAIFYVTCVALLVSGFAMMDDTMTRFLELRKSDRWLDALLLTVVLTFTIYSEYFHGDPKIRVEVLVLALAAQTGRSGYNLLRRAPAELKIPARFLSVTFFLFTFFCVWRLVIPILMGQSLGVPDDEQAMMLGAVSRLSKVVLLCASVAFGYLWMAALQLSAELDALSLTDPLTSTMNRRGLEDRLRRELQRAEVAGTKVALVALDVDHFKLINDRHGHHAGDIALVAFTRAMSDMLRPTDALGRFGGEEFVAVLPRTDEAGAMLVAERLRSSLSEVVFDFDPHMRLTASFGVSICESKEDVQDALRRCDRALYAAKQAGRNRVVAHSSLKPELVRGRGSLERFEGFPADRPVL